MLTSQNWEPGVHHLGRRQGLPRWRNCPTRAKWCQVLINRDCPPKPCGPPPKKSLDHSQVVFISDAEFLMQFSISFLNRKTHTRIVRHFVKISTLKENKTNGGKGTQRKQPERQEEQKHATHLKNPLRVKGASPWNKKLQQKNIQKPEKALKNLKSFFLIKHRS